MFDDPFEHLKFLKQIRGYNRNKVAMSNLLVNSLEVKTEFLEFLEHCENIGSKRPQIEMKTCTLSNCYMLVKKNKLPKVSITK